MTINIELVNKKDWCIEHKKKKCECGCKQPIKRTHVKSCYNCFYAKSIPLNLMTIKCLLDSKETLIDSVCKEHVNHESIED